MTKVRFSRKVKFTMEKIEERKHLIEKDKEFIAFPPPNYSNMTNEQIKLRTSILESAFELAFKKDTYKIQRITKIEASNIIKNYAPEGLFMIEENGHYIGIDNSTGECWVEEFITKDLCIKWLKGDVEM